MKKAWRESIRRVRVRVGHETTGYYEERGTGIKKNRNGERERKKETI
jgi:hypothetical protein